MNYPHPRLTREKPHPRFDRKVVREATCGMCGTWFVVTVLGRMTCGSKCVRRATALRRKRAT
jgi:hypothetical protein